jgi:hypothetical protein
VVVVVLGKKHNITTAKMIAVVEDNILQHTNNRSIHILITVVQATKSNHQIFLIDIWKSESHARPAGLLTSLLPSLPSYSQPILLQAIAPS